MIFLHSATCSDGFYVCDVETLENDNSQVIKQNSSTIDSPIVVGCESKLILLILLLYYFLLMVRTEILAAGVSVVGKILAMIDKAAFAHIGRSGTGSNFLIMHGGKIPSF